MEKALDAAVEAWPAALAEALGDCRADTSRVAIIDVMVRVAEAITAASHDSEAQDPPGWYSDGAPGLSWSLDLDTAQPTLRLRAWSIHPSVVFELGDGEEVTVDDLISGFPIDEVGIEAMPRFIALPPCPPHSGSSPASHGL